MNVTVEQLLEFADYIASQTDNDGCCHETPEEMVAFFFEVEVAPRVKDEAPSSVPMNPFTAEERSAFAAAISNFEDSLTMSTLTKRVQR